MNKIWAIVGATLGFFIIASNDTSASTPSGSGFSPVTRRSNVPAIRNRNPGNIIKTSGSPYQGEITPTDRFKKFSSFVWGTRAMLHLLRRYINEFGANTISKIINRWAPVGSENSQVVVNNYIQKVSEWSGIAPNAVLTFDKDTMRRVAMAMARYEAGEPNITDAEYHEAWRLLTGNTGIYFDPSNLKQ